ncbi:MAG: YidC/Oxa1 family membrane protein insertase [Actinomycetota bacterium]|nr:YidC/Oxa1 family membrane protein insertase [Actinomycetota bacterium]
MIFAAIPGLDWLGKIIAYVLRYFTSITGGSFGGAILLLTVAMRLALLPLTWKQTKSMMAMQRLQPQLKELQQKYKDDKEKQGQEIMALYKRENVSPFGGCLPMILQLPILFAVFDVLNDIAVAKGKSKYIALLGVGSGGFNFLGVDTRLAGSKLWASGNFAGLIVLVLLTVVTGYISSKMMTTDPKQSKMMAFMPVIMGFFAWVLPAGVTIYIVATNILTIVQQYTQLEVEGYYDQKRAQRKKADEKWYEKAKWGLLDAGSRLLVLLHLKKPLQEKKEDRLKKGAKSGAVAKSSVGMSSNSGSGEAKKKMKEKQGVQEKGKTSGKAGSAGAKKAGAKGSVTKASGRTAKKYPAKKQGKKKK